MVNVRRYLLVHAANETHPIFISFLSQSRHSELFISGKAAADDQCIIGIVMYGPDVRTTKEKQKVSDAMACRCVYSYRSL